MNGFIMVPTAEAPGPQQSFASTQVRHLTSVVPVQRAVKAWKSTSGRQPRRPSMLGRRGFRVWAVR